MVTLAEQFRVQTPIYTGRGRRLRMLILSLGLSLLMLAGFWTAWEKLKDPSLLPVGVVGVNGHLTHMSQEDLKSAISNLVRRGLFAVDVAAVRGEILELPWVEEATVRRVWPNRIEITIHEFEPVARWRDDQLVNAQGIAFRPRPKEIPLDLPQLWGPEGQQAEVTQRFFEMNEALRTIGLQLVRLVQDDRLSWRMELNGGLLVELGQKDAERRFAQLIKAYPKLVDRRSGSMLRVDLRYPNGMAVAWSRGAIPK